MKGKIIDISNGIITVGTDEGTTLRTIQENVCFMNPQIGDAIEIVTAGKEILLKLDNSGNASANTELTDQVQQQDQKQEQQQEQEQEQEHQEQHDPKMHVYVHEPDKKIYTDGPDGKVVNKVAYCLLALFLGGIGAHKFYSGKIAKGVIYLLFCWTFVPGIIAFIEFLIGLSKPSDDRGNIII